MPFFSTVRIRSLLPTAAVAALSVASLASLDGDGSPAASTHMRAGLAVLPQARLDGEKIAERHHDAAMAEADSGHGLIIPAYVLMPMILEWPAAPANAPLIVAAASPRAAVSSRAGSTAKPMQMPVPRPHDPPLQLVRHTVAPQPAAAIQVAAVQNEERPGWLRQGLAGAGEIVGGTTGAIARAGAWTVTAAASLLPDF